MAELRARLLQCIHDNLDDDLARAVYADHLLEHDPADWHAELIRLQLDGGDRARINAIIEERKTRVLGPLVRLFEVTWVRGFPERARTRRWTDEHITRLVESRHLPTLRSIELAYVEPASLPSLLAAPPVVTERITELVIANASLADVAGVLDSDAFPALRTLGLYREARSKTPHPDTDVLAALFASKLARQVTRIGIWSPHGERLRWAALVPPNVAQLDVFEFEYTHYTETAFSFVRRDGVLEEATDPVIPIAAQLVFYRSPYNLCDGWPLDRLHALEHLLLRDGHRYEAESVRELIDYPDNDE